MSPAPTKQNVPPVALYATLRRPWVRALLWLLALGAVCGSGWRAWQYRHTEGDYTRQTGGFFDFHHGVYFPTKAFLDGVSPYGKDYVDNYPQETPITLFLPTLFILHAPLSWAPLPVADAACFALGVALTLAVAWCTGRAVRATEITPLVACLLLLSRSGHSTLFTGYCTMELVLGTILALEHAARRPWLSAVGMLLVACKPTFLAPLAVLMACRGNWAAVLRGSVLTGVVAGAGLLWLVANTGVDGLLQSVAEAELYDPLQVNCLPVNTSTRIDLHAIVCKWIGHAPGVLEQLAVMALLLAPAGWTLRRLRHAGDADGSATPSGAVAAIALLASIHHQFYDLPVLAPAVAGMLLCRPEPAWRWVPDRTRTAAALLAMAPAYNVTTVDLLLQWIAPDPTATLHMVLTSANAVLLVAAWTLLTAAVWRHAPPAAGDAPFESEIAMREPIGHADGAPALSEREPHGEPSAAPAVIHESDQRGHWQ